jgi:hypothetical protein
VKTAKNNVKRRMAEAPVDLKQPRPKRNRRPTQKVHDNEKQQHEKKKLKTMQLPPSAAFRLKNQSPSCLLREGQWLKSEPPVMKIIQSPAEGHEADNTKHRSSVATTTNARKAVRSTRITGLTRKKQASHLRLMINGLSTKKQPPNLL